MLVLIELIGTLTHPCNKKTFHKALIIIISFNFVSHSTFRRYILKKIQYENTNKLKVGARWTN